VVAREVTVEPTFEPGRSRSTPDLLRHVLDEAKLLARAEVAVGREEIKAEVNRAKGAGVALGIAGALAVCALSLFLVAIALALPMADWGGALLVAVVVLVFAAIAAAIGARLVPKRPMQRTKERLTEDVTLARERLQ
jgi:hypothetical protein